MHRTSRKRRGFRSGVTGAGWVIRVVRCTAHLMATKAALYWSEREPPAEIHDTAQLDARLDGIAASCKPGVPTIVDLHVHRHLVSFGLGSPETFVQIQSESGMPPYFVTVGDPTVEGVVTFYLMGSHHTEILRRHVVSSEVAREIVREFFVTGHRPMQVEWEEV
jgi:hypothetical protein